MKISACWIVKNEEANITRSIESLCKIADELIVMDTGSTDKTIEIAEKCGAKVYSFEWTRDFSEARNYTISKATGDIIFFIDADEWFAPGLVPENKKLIEQIFKDKDRPDAISFRRYNLDTRTGTVATVDGSVRAFINHPRLRYTRKVHEQLTDMESKNPASTIHFDRWKLMHSGYSPEIVNQKAIRNIEILKEMLAEGKASSLHRFYLVRENCAIGNYMEAFDYFEDLMRDESAVSQLASKYGTESGLAGSFFYLSLRLSFMFRKKVSRRELYDRLVKKMQKSLPDFPGTIAYPLAYQVYFDLKEDVFLNALEDYERLPQKEPASMDDSYRGSMAAIYKNAAIMCWRRDDNEKAMRYATACLKNSKRFDETVMIVLLDCLRGRNNTDIIQHLTNTFDFSDAIRLRQVTNSLRCEDFKIPYMYLLKRQIDNETATIADFLYMMILAGKHQRAVQAAVDMQEEFNDSGAIGQSIFLAAICSEDDSIFADHRKLLADYANILEAYFKRLPLEMVTDADRAILKTNYLYIVFAAGLQTGDRFLDVFSANRNLCFEIKANYLMSSGRFDMVLSEDTGSLEDDGVGLAYIVIECCLRTGKYEEALTRIKNYLQKIFIFPGLLQNLLLISEKAADDEIRSTAKALYDKYMCLYDEYIDLEDVINTGYVVEDANKKRKKYLKSLSPSDFDAQISSASSEVEWEQLTDIRFKAAGIYEEKKMPAMAEPIYRRILACGGNNREAYERLCKVYESLKNVTLSQHIRDKYLA